MVFDGPPRMVVGARLCMSVRESCLSFALFSGHWQTLSEFPVLIVGRATEGLLEQLTPQNGFLTYWTLSTSPGLHRRGRPLLRQHRRSALPQLVRVGLGSCPRGLALGSCLDSRRHAGHDVECGHSYCQDIAHHQPDNVAGDSLRCGIICWWAPVGTSSTCLDVIASRFAAPEGHHSGRLKALDIVFPHRERCLLEVGALKSYCGKMRQRGVRGSDSADRQAYYVRK